MSEIELDPRSAHTTELPLGQVDDPSLLRAYAEMGDRQSMNLLLARHADAAYRVALRCCRNPADAEDAVQGAFIEILGHAANYRGQSAVRAWIFGFVVNACRHKLREERRRAARESRSSVDGSRVPADLQVREIVRQAVHDLPRHYRLPVWLHYCEGLSSPEVAEALGLSENTVRSQLSRGVEELRAVLTASSLALPAGLLVAALSAIPKEAAPVSLAASVPGLAPAGAGTPFGAGWLPRAVAGSMSAAAVFSVAAALWWGQPPEEPRPPEFANIDRKIEEWRPSPEERRFDRIGWCRDLPEALKLAHVHRRPIFLVAHVGSLRTGRSDGGSMALREGPLGDPAVIELINSSYVPAFVSTEDPANLEMHRIYDEARKAKLSAGSERIYFLGTEGRVLASLHICHITTASLLESLRTWAAAPGPTLVAPRSQSVVLAGTPGIRVVSRYLDGSGKPLKPISGSAYHIFPAEDWMELTAQEESALLPGIPGPPGSTWNVEPTAAAQILSRIYPLTGNFGSPEKNHLTEVRLTARVLSGRRSTAWIRLAGRVLFTHSFFADKDERPVEAELAGYLEYDRREQKLRALRLVTRRATYGKEEFGAALELVR